MPLGRVQAVDTVRGPVQRLFGVVGVHVQTAGGGREAEIVLPALSAGDVAALRDAVGARRPATAPPRRRRRRPSRSGGGGSAAGSSSSPRSRPASSACSCPSLAAPRPAPGRRVPGRRGTRRRPPGRDLAPDTAAEWVLLGSRRRAARLAAQHGRASWSTFAGFTVARDGDRLRIRRGLVARREASVPVARVQAVARRGGRAAPAVAGSPLLRIEVAGYKAEAAGGADAVPAPAPHEVRGLLDELLPELADAPDRLAPRAARGRHGATRCRRRSRGSPPARAAALLVPGGADRGRCCSPLAGARLRPAALARGGLAAGGRAARGALRAGSPAPPCSRPPRRLQEHALSPDDPAAPRAAGRRRGARSARARAGACTTSRPPTAARAVRGAARTRGRPRRAT